MKQTIAIDMDGVIADIEPHLFKWYQKETGVTLTKEAVRGLREEEAFSDKTAFLKMVNTPSFFRTAPVMKDAVETVKSLMESYEIYIVSAAMEFPLSLFEKREWLAEHFPFISWKNIVFCGDKSIIDTDFLIDDHGKNLDFFKGKSLMFTAFHNVNLNHHQRINNWLEVPGLLKALSSTPAATRSTR